MKIGGFFLLKFHLNFPRGPINNRLTVVQIKAGHRKGDKPLYKPMMALFISRMKVSRSLKLKHG